MRVESMSAHRFAFQWEVRQQPPQLGEPHHFFSQLSSCAHSSQAPNSKTQRVAGTRDGLTWVCEGHLGSRHIAQGAGPMCRDMSDADRDRGHYHTRPCPSSIIQHFSRRSPSQKRGPIGVWRLPTSSFRASIGSKPCLRQWVPLVAAMHPTLSHVPALAVLRRRCVVCEPLFTGREDVLRGPIPQADRQR